MIGLRDYLEDHTMKNVTIGSDPVPEPIRSKKRSKELKRPRVIRIVLAWQRYFVYDGLL